MRISNTTAGRLALPEVREERRSFGRPRACRLLPPARVGYASESAHRFGRAGPVACARLPFHAAAPTFGRRPPASPGEGGRARSECSGIPAGPPHRAPFLFAGLRASGAERAATAGDEAAGTF